MYKKMREVRIRLLTALLYLLGRWFHSLLQFPLPLCHRG
jgi:hypothetical protein